MKKPIDSLPVISAPPVATVVTPSPPAKETPAQTEDGDSSQYIEHIIQSGDTVASIAAQYQTTEDRIVEINKLVNSTLLYVGQRLLIPVTTPNDSTVSTSQPLTQTQVTGTVTFTTQAKPTQLVRVGEASFKGHSYEISIDSCEFQSTSDEKTFDRYLCTGQWKNKSSKGLVLHIHITLQDANGIELASDGVITSYAPDSSGDQSVKVLVDYPQAEQVAKYSVIVEEQ